jgi:hypothetical protein
LEPGCLLPGCGQRIGLIILNLNNRLKPQAEQQSQGYFEGGISLKNKALLWTILFSLTIMISVIPSFAAPPAGDGFLGVPWGADMKQVEIKLQQTKGFKQTFDQDRQQFIKEHEAPGYGEIIFEGTVANRFACITCVFQNNSLYKGEIRFVDQNRPDSFEKLKQYSSEWKNNQFILNFYEEITGLLIEKCGLPVCESGEKEKFGFTNEAQLGAKVIAAEWLLTGGTSGDKINIVCKGISGYYSNIENGLKDTGLVEVVYTNQSLYKRLLSSKPVNTVQDL